MDHLSLIQYLAMQVDRLGFTVKCEWIKGEWWLSSLAIWMDNKWFPFINLFIGTTRVNNELVLSCMSWIGAWSRPAAFQLCLQATSTSIERGGNVHGLRDLVWKSTSDWSGESGVSENGKGNIVCACSVTCVNIDTGQRGAHTAKRKLEISLEDALVFKLKVKYYSGFSTLSTSKTKCFFSLHRWPKKTGNEPETNRSGCTW